MSSASLSSLLKSRSSDVHQVKELVASLEPSVEASRHLPAPQQLQNRETLNKLAKRVAKTAESHNQLSQIAAAELPPENQSEQLALQKRLEKACDRLEEFLMGAEIICNILAQVPFLSPYISPALVVIKVVRTAVQVVRANSGSISTGWLELKRALHNAWIKIKSFFNMAPWFRKLFQKRLRPQETDHTAPASSPVQEDPSASWACRVCSFLNPFDGCLCLACSLPKEEAQKKNHLSQISAPSAHLQLERYPAGSGHSAPAIFSSLSSSSPSASRPPTASARAGRQGLRPSEVNVDRIFSFTLTVHLAEGLKQLRSEQQPYAVVYWGEPRRGHILSRSDVGAKFVAATGRICYSWEHKATLLTVWPEEALWIEVRDWCGGIRDPCLGRTDPLFMSYVRPSTSDPTQSPFLKYEKTLKLGPRPDHCLDLDITGALSISYVIGPPQLDRKFDERLIPSATRPPDFHLHTANYGVVLPNFRDAGGWPVTFPDRVTGLPVLGRMKSKLVFRSSAVHRATEHDSFLFYQHLQIRSLLDLRTNDSAGNRGPFLTDYYRVVEPETSCLFSQVKRTTWDPSHLKIEILPQDHESTIAVSETQRKALSPELRQSMTMQETSIGVDFFDRRPAERHTTGAGLFGSVYLLSLVGTDFQLGIIKKSKKTKVLLAGVAAESPQAQRRALCAPIFDRPNALSVLYRLLLKNSTSEICLFFQTLLDSPAPVLIYCNHGKDRTGLMVALLQILCGVARDTVVYGYALSDWLLYPIRDLVDFEMTDAGQDPMIMSRTPAQAMIDALNFIDQRYGDVPNYLNRIGFSYAHQDSIRKKFVDVA